jgi:hypothetical protein
MMLQFDETIPSEQAQSYRDFFDAHPELEKLFINMLFPDPLDLQPAIDAAVILAAIINEQ